MILNFSKSETINISGLVIDTTNSPIKKAEVILQNLMGNTLAEEATDRKGGFKIKDIEPNYYYLLIKYDQVNRLENGETSSKKI